MEPTSAQIYWGVKRKGSVRLCCRLVDAVFWTTGPCGNETHAGPGQVSEVLVTSVMVVVMVVVMPCASERRSGKYHQEEKCGEELFHE
jgi:hypothetical protein